MDVDYFGQREHMFPHGKKSSLAGAQGLGGGGGEHHSGRALTSRPGLGLGGGGGRAI